jgi:hypothetical protein
MKEGRWRLRFFFNKFYRIHCKKRPAHNNVVENRPEQYFAAIFAV